jgi:hypothetical protein
MGYLLDKYFGADTKTGAFEGPKADLRFKP